PVSAVNAPTAIPITQSGNRPLMGGLGTGDGADGSNAAGAPFGGGSSSIRSRLAPPPGAAATSSARPFLTRELGAALPSAPFRVSSAASPSSQRVNAAESSRIDA